MSFIIYPWKPTCNAFLTLLKQEVAQQRLQLFHSINGNAFFPLTWWPDDMQMAFWKKPIIDSDMFKLVLFFLGNGCSPLCHHQEEAHQIDYIVINTNTKANPWFYYNVNHKKLLYLSTLPRCVPNIARQQ